MAYDLVAVTRYTRQLARLRALVLRGVAPTAAELLPGHADVVDELIAAYGSLARARRAIGIRRVAAYETDEAALAALRHIVGAGERPTPKRLRELGEEGLLKYIYGHFGSITKARELVGATARLERPRVPVLPRPDALAELRRLMDEQPGLRAQDVRGALCSALVHHFGTLTAAFAELGIHVGTKAKWNEELIVAALADRLREGKRITDRALLADGRADLWNAIHRYVGGTPEARRRAEAMVGIRHDAPDTASAWAARTKRHRARATAVEPRSAPSVVGADDAKPQARPRKRGGTAAPAPAKRRPRVSAVSREPLRPSEPAGAEPSLPDRWAMFVTMCADAAARGGAPPAELTTLVPDMIFAGMHSEVASAGAVLVKVARARAELLALQPTGAQHVALSDVLNALECVGVRLPANLVALRRGWIMQLPTVLSSTATIVARLAVMPATKDRGELRDAETHQGAPEIARLLARLTRRRRSNGDEARWRRMVAAAVRGEPGDLGRAGVLWAARVLYNRLGGAPLGEVAGRLLREAARQTRARP